MRRALCACISAFLCASAVNAGDGVIEINQAKALAGGVNTCDTPDFPVTICEAGSYRLTSNLTYTVGDAVVITAPYVSLDLNGMTVRGDNSCSTGPGGWVVSCVYVDGTAAIAGPGWTTVSNGRVISARGTAIWLGDGSRLRDVQVSDNGGRGALLGDRTSVSNVSSIGNRFAGIECSGSCALSEIEVTNNGSNGIEAGDQSLVSNAVVGTNQLVGLEAGTGSRVSDVVAVGNGQDGIVLGASSKATGVTSTSNVAHGIQLGTGSGLQNFNTGFNGGSGVRALDGSLVSNGALRGNGTKDPTAYGLHVQGGAGYRALVITSVTGGNSATVVPGGVNLGNNTCQGGACP